MGTSFRLTSARVLLGWSLLRGATPRPARIAIRAMPPQTPVRCSRRVSGAKRSCEKGCVAKPTGWSRSEGNPTLRASCHCGAVVLELPAQAANAHAVQLLDLPALRRAVDVLLAQSC